MKFYAGLPVVSDQPELDGHHITTMFAPLIPTGRFRVGMALRTGYVDAVVYWPNCDKTVVLVNCPYAELRHAHWTSKGFKYDFPYVPHITICDGDQAYRMQYLIGSAFTVNREYIRIMLEGMRMNGNMSGCELAKYLKEIGVTNIRMCIDSDELLDQYSDETLLDHIINRRDCDIGKFVTALLLSVVPTEHEALVLPEIGALLERVDSL